MDLIAIKLFVTPALMLAVTLAANRWGSFVGGVLAGMPLTSGPILLYLTIEQGPGFAANAASGTTTGIASALVSYLAYGVISAYAGRVISAGAMLAAYFAAARSMMAAPSYLQTWTVILSALGCIFFLTRNTRRSADSALSPAWDLPARIFASTAIVFFVTTSARALGAEWSGIFTPIPVIAWPLIVFVHAQRGRPDCLAVLRGTAAGSVATLAFCTIVRQYIDHLPAAQVFLMATMAAAATSILSALALIQHQMRVDQSR
ncbi:MAG TPA: hypothetical protein VGC77_20915 [Rhodopseudomonas sp.]|uniref:hypothetical protein n=1 Tax=Rhodopseudomonas sp. TaxID=1078 RepID=UPI002EDA0E81